LSQWRLRRSIVFGDFGDPAFTSRSIPRYYPRYYPMVTDTAALATVLPWRCGFAAAAFVAVGDV
jgi:hypothetical protein